MKYFLLTFLLLLTKYGFSCTCGPIPYITEAFKNSDKVVIGTIVNKEQIIQIDSIEYNRLLKKGVNETQAKRFTSGGYYQYTLILSEPSYKGTFATDTIFIRTGLTSGSCGYSFQQGKKYVVYGYDKDPIPNEYIDRSEQFWTSNCTRTSLFSERERKKLAKIVRQTKKKSP